MPKDVSISVHYEQIVDLEETSLNYKRKNLNVDDHYEKTMVSTKCHSEISKGIKGNNNISC